MSENVCHNPAAHAQRTHKLQLQLERRYGNSIPQPQCTDSLQSAACAIIVMSQCYRF